MMDVIYMSTSLWKKTPANSMDDSTVLSDFFDWEANIAMATMITVNV